MKKIESFWQKLIRGEKRSLFDRFIFTFLCLLSYIYELIWEFYLLLYQKSLLKKTPLKVTIISIGNLTLGGTGKTSFAEMLAEKLKNYHLNIAILSRGYGAPKKQNGNLVSDGKKVLLPPEVAGDEAYYLAKSLNDVSVLVGKDRIANIIYLQKIRGNYVFILDDGFQYLKLKKDVEMVLIDATNPFGNYKIFPAGTLRERIKNLRRANYIVLTKVNLPNSKDLIWIKETIRKIHPSSPIIEVIYQPEILKNIYNGETYSAEWLKDKLIFTLCGIGNPASFEKMLKDLSERIIERFRFPDHHFYTAEEILKVSEEAKKQKALVVTTEKDAVRIPRLNIDNIFSLKVKMEVTSGKNHLDELIEKIKEGKLT